MKEPLCCLTPIIQSPRIALSLWVKVRRLECLSLSIVSGRGHFNQNHLGTKSWNKRTKAILGEYKMRKEYNFSEAKRNPYVKRLKKAITIRLEPDVITYFKSLSSDTGIPYQNLINLYLLDCAKEQRRLALTWKK